MFKQNSNCALVTVMYKGVESFIHTFFEAVNIQTDKDFDVIIFNHTASEETIKNIPQKYHTQIITLSPELNPVEVRNFIFSFACEKVYQKIIFSDIDDWFSGNRIEILKILLNDYDFVFNELHLVNRDNQITKKNLLQDLQINDEKINIEQLIDRNFIGLGNAGFNLSKINFKQILPFPKDLIALDWYLFSIIILLGYKGKFTPAAFTYYRQHDNNLVGVNTLLTQSKLNFGIEAKIKHYTYVNDFINKNKLQNKDIFQVKKNEMINLKNTIQDISFMENYLNVINNQFDNIYTGWWSEILPLETWRKYAK